MATLGFEEYIEPLKVYLHKFREVCTGYGYLGCTAKQKIIELFSNDWGWISALEVG
jgi:hypothetical protein